MLVLAPSGSGKSELSRMFDRVVDGDEIIRDKVAWPPGEWWKTMPADELADFRAQCNAALTPSVDAVDVIVVVAFYSKWRYVPDSMMAIAMPDAVSLYLNSVQRRATNPRSVQPRYASVEDARQAIESFSNKLKPRSGPYYSTVPSAAGVLARGATGAKVAGLWHTHGRGASVARVVTAYDGLDSGRVIMFSSPGAKPVRIASGDEALAVGDELAQNLTGGTKGKEPLVTWVADEIAKCDLALFDQYGWRHANGQ